MEFLKILFVNLMIALGFSGALVLLFVGFEYLGITTILSIMSVLFLILASYDEYNEKKR